MSPACMRISRTTFTLQSYITLQQVSRLSSWSRSPSDLIKAGAASLTKRRGIGPICGVQSREE